jgi:hypothetical protein
MIRYALCLAAAPLAAGPVVAAEPLVVDAFGLVPLAALSQDRAAWAGQRLVDGTEEVVAPEAPENVSIFVGPKSLVAGSDLGHAVALVLDRHGNLVEDGLAARFVLGGEPFDTTTRDGIADVLFRPSTTAATYVAGAEVAGRQSTRASFRVTADIASLGPVVVTQASDATRETMLELTSGPLTDRYGNLAEDGTLSTILISGPGEATMIAAQVRDARVRGELLLRDTGGGRLNATIASRTDPSGAVTLAPLSHAGPVEVALWPLPEIGALGLRVGPIPTTDGHLLPDGAPLSVEVSASGAAHRVRGWVRDVVFEAVLPLDPATGLFTIVVETALGRQQSTVTPVPRLRRVEVAD